MAGMEINCSCTCKVKGKHYFLPGSCDKARKHKIGKIQTKQEVSSDPSGFSHGLYPGDFTWREEPRRKSQTSLRQELAVPETPFFFSKPACCPPLTFSCFASLPVPVSQESPA